MNLCGCKLTTKAPFCDGVTCAKIRNGEEILAKPKVVNDVKIDN